MIELKSMNDVFIWLRNCETEEELKRFYREYLAVVRDAVCEEDGVTAGDIIPRGKVLERFFSNLGFLIDDLSEMRKDYAKKIFWFMPEFF